MRNKARAKRKASGGRYRDGHKKKLREVAKIALQTRLDKVKVKVRRTKGGNQKKGLMSSDSINVFDGSKFKKVKIEEVVENTANRHFVRRNILTKGALVKTELGNVKVTNRPGQDGFLSGILVK